MQLELFDDLYVLEQEGYTVDKTFECTGDKRFTNLENTYSIILNGKTILYVQNNENGTFNTFGFMKERFNLSLKEVLKTVENKNNWCL